MSVIRQELVNDAFQKAFALADYNIHDNIDKQHEFKNNKLFLMIIRYRI